MVWGRVAGVILDIATLVPVVLDDSHHAAASGAMAFVATAMDVAVAMQGDEA